MEESAEFLRLKVMAELDRAARAGRDVGDAIDAMLAQATDRYLAGDSTEAIKIWTQVIETPGTHAQVARALLDRATTFLDQDTPLDAVADLTKAIDLPDIPNDLRLRALAKRAIARMNVDQQGSIADATAVIDGVDVPASLRIDARDTRGVLYALTGATDLAIEDFTAVAKDPEASSTDIAYALLNRGIANGTKELREREIEDYSMAIDLPDVQPHALARLLVNRGYARQTLGALELAVADYGRVLDLPDAPTDQIIKALLNRAVAYHRMGEDDQAATDCVRVVEHRGSTDDQVSAALGTLGWLHYKQGKGDAARFAELSRQALIKNPDNLTARGNLALAELMLGRDSAAAEHYKVIVQSGVDIGLLRELRTDLAQARDSWLGEERAAPMMAHLDSIP